MATNALKPSNEISPGSNSPLARQLRGMTGSGLLLLLAAVVVSIFLLPMVYMATIAFRDDKKMFEGEAPWYPAQAATFTYQGEDYPIYMVPDASGKARPLAIVKRSRVDADFVDPTNPGAGLINWQGAWRTLDRPWTPYFTADNFSETWRPVDYPLVFRNSLFVAVSSVILDLIACTIVAYGYARFRVPGKGIMFWILISTIILPVQVTQIPLFTFFVKLGWTGTFLPLIVPAIFANAFDVFLLRQFMMSIPKEMDEAAMIDGAGPVKTLTSIILPQMVPIIIAVGMFHFFFKWNDFFTPLIYLFGKESLFTIPLALQKMNSTFGSYPGLAMAGAMIAVALPISMFVVAQRWFMQGVVMTGVDK